MTDRGFCGQPAAPERRADVIWMVSDSVTMIQRSLRHVTRNVDSLLIGFFLPVLLLLLFVYVLGGAIDTGDMVYVNYVVPGIILLCSGYGASLTAISIATDMQLGLIDRFRSLPIHSTAVLTGHVVASVARNAISTVLVLAVALLIGFRPAASPGGWLVAAGILLLFVLAMSWMSVVFGLLAKSVEASSAFSFVVLFLPYISSAFVPPQTMPGVLRWLAEHQPINHVVETLRAITGGEPAGSHAWLAAAWCGGIAVLCYALSMRLFLRKTT
jgi:ABC-2 type transport system permease protein